MTPNHPEFDKIIAALRSRANADELSGEDIALEAMASTLATTPGTGRSFGSARSLRVVAVVAASLIGMGGIAAAGATTLRPARDNGKIDSADTTLPETTIPETTVPETTIPETTVPETTVPATTIPETTIPETTIPETTIPETTIPGAEPMVDDPATEFDETQCAEGNHGATVSSIAKETPPGPGHGEVVSEAAHSSCGKDKTDDTIADDGTDTTIAATDDDSPGTSAGHGNSNGHGSGNGNSGGNGNGRGNGKPGG